ncbi:MAG: hypothetical protein LBM04_08730 [Opitutaceae bacterium]|nr:hypothetical protein [Opitutaceae bacterium]
MQRLQFILLTLPGRICFIYCVCYFIPAASAIRRGTTATHILALLLL